MYLANGEDKMDELKWLFGINMLWSLLGRVPHTSLFSKEFNTDLLRPIASEWIASYFVAP